MESWEVESHCYVPDEVDQELYCGGAEDCCREADSLWDRQTRRKQWGGAMNFEYFIKLQNLFLLLGRKLVTINESFMFSPMQTTHLEPLTSLRYCQLAVCSQRRKL